MAYSPFWKGMPIALGLVLGTILAVRGGLAGEKSCVVHRIAQEVQQVQGAHGNGEARRRPR